MAVLRLEILCADLRLLQQSLCEELEVLKCGWECEKGDDHEERNRPPLLLNTEARHGMKPPMRWPSFEGMVGASVQLGRGPSYDALPSPRGERTLKVADAEDEPEQSRGRRATVVRKTFKPNKTAASTYLLSKKRLSSIATSTEQFYLALLQFVSGNAFAYLTGLAVILNVLWLGFVTDYTARNWTEELPKYFVAVDGCFCMAAAAELLTRTAAYGWREHFFGEDMKWHLFDLSLVLAQIFDLATSLGVARGAGLKEMRMVRCLKLVRCLRIARIATVFPELHILMVSIVDSFYGLLWTFVIMMSFIYAMALVLTEVVNAHKLQMGAEHMEKHERRLLELYGSIDASMLSLYMMISEGIHWNELEEPLAKHISPWMKLVFVIFVGFQIFGMLNVLSSSCIDNAMRIAAKTQRDKALQSVWEVMHIDVGPEGVVTPETFHRLFEHPQMEKFLDLAHAADQNPLKVFRVVDMDEGGELTADDFVGRCARLLEGPSSFQIKLFAADQIDSIVERLERLKNK